MIGMAYVAVRRWIGPREVLQAAPWQMRVQFWVLVASGVAIATVTVSARGEIVQQTNWIVYWPMAVWIASTLVAAGYLLAKFDALKDTMAKNEAATTGRLDALEAATVKKDVLAEMLAGLKSDIAHVRELLENNSRGWRDLHHGSKE